MPPSMLADHTTPTAHFDTEAAEVMQGLRTAFLALIENLPQVIERAADLERALAVSPTLAWQVHRVGTSPEVLASGAHVPGRAAARQALAAARSKGVPEPIIEAAAKALERFEALVAEHAGDRGTFTTMINNLAGGEADHIDLATRRQAFRLNSRIWGVQVKTTLCTALHHPGKDSRHVDYVMIRGMRDIRRLRTGAPFHLSGIRVRDASEASIEPQQLDDKAADSAKANLLAEFCTERASSFEFRPAPDGYLDAYLQDAPLGNAGMQTFYMCDVMRDCKWQEHDGSSNAVAQRHMVLKPTETLVIDALIHRDMYGTLTPEARLFGSLNPYGGAADGDYLPEEVLPIRLPVHKLGTGLAVLPLAQVPKYSAIIEAVCRPLGWDPDGFEAFRCVYEFPILGSQVKLRLPLPNEGNW